MLKPILNAEETVKGTKVLISQRPYNKFIEDNGKMIKTEIIEGYSYECVAVEKKFERIIQCHIKNFMKVILSQIINNQLRFKHMKIEYPPWIFTLLIFLIKN